VLRDVGSEIQGYQQAELEKEEAFQAERRVWRFVILVILLLLLFRHLEEEQQWERVTLLHSKDS